MTVWVSAVFPHYTFSHIHMDAQCNHHSTTAQHPKVLFLWKFPQFLVCEEPESSQQDGCNINSLGLLKVSLSPQSELLEFEKYYFDFRLKTAAFIVALSS